MQIDNYHAIKAEARLFLKKMLEDLYLKDYSPKTIDNYLRCVTQYFIYFGEVPKFVDELRIREFLLNLRDKGRAPQTVNLHLNAIKYFYKHIIRSKKKILIKFAKKARRLPVVLSREEIDRILQNVRNNKHQIMISLAYGAGLRVSEVVKLKVQDVDFCQSIIFIRQSKGKKDRVTILPKKLEKDLVEFFRYKNPNQYFFESQRGGALTSRTIQIIFKKAFLKTGINKDATFHSLRHSFATHLIENGVSIRYVQELLGHRDISTTQKYTQVTRKRLCEIPSPFN